MRCGFSFSSVFGIEIVCVCLFDCLVGLTVTIRSFKNSFCLFLCVSFLGFDN